MDYNALISAYSSFFELTVAFNLAYATSEQFRDVIKSGFLKDSRHLSARIKEVAETNKAKIQVTIQSDTFINNLDKEAIEKKFKNISNKINNSQNDLENAIEKTQSIASNQLKPFYIVSALFGLFVLFLAGQETVHSFFPQKELTIAFFGSVCISLCLLFTIVISKAKISIFLIVFVEFCLFLLSIYITNILNILKYLNTSIYDMIILGNEIFTNKSLVNFSLFLCIAPFFVSYTILFLKSFIDYIIFSYRLENINKEINTIYKNIENFKTSNDFLKNLRK